MAHGPADIADPFGRGRKGVMPAGAIAWVKTNALLVAAWVYAQSHPPTVAAQVTS